MHYVTTRDNVQLYIKVWGKGRPIILIHGWPLSADSWDEVALELSEAGYQTIAYDRRGFGRSDKPWSGYNYDSLADDLADVIKHCVVSDATLAGFSMGGGEVARYMSKHGGRNVQSVALISSIVPYMLETDDNPHGVPQTTFDQMTDKIKGDRAGCIVKWNHNCHTGSLPTTSSTYSPARSESNFGGAFRRCASRDIILLFYTYFPAAMSRYGTSLADGAKSDLADVANRVSAIVEAV